MEVDRRYTLSEVARLLKTKDYVIRQYEQKFSPYLTIPRDEKGARYFTLKEIDQLRFIFELRNKHGLNLDAIRNVLDKQKEPQAIPVEEQADATILETSLQTLDRRNETSDIMLPAALKAELVESLAREFRAIQQDQVAATAELSMEVRRTREQVLSEIAKLKMQIRKDRYRPFWKKLLNIYEDI